MPAVSESALSVAANAKSTERLSTTDLGFAPFDGMLQIYAKGSATGLNLNLFAGSDIVVNDQPIPYTGTAGTLSTNDNLINEVAVSAGSKLSLSFRNTTGGALTVDYILSFDPL